PYNWEGGKGYEQSVRMLLSGGQEYIPEAMQIYTTDFAVELISNNVLTPLDDLLPKHAPLLWNKLSKKEWDLIRSFSPDNKIYFIPNVSADPRVSLIRKDWLKAVGINKVPETKAELLAAYRAFKKKDANGNGDPNDEIPVSGRAGMRWCDDLFMMHGVSMTEGYPQFRWDPNKKVMICDQISDEMKNAITFIRQLVKEGLMDKTMPIQPAQDWFARLADDKIGQYYHSIAGIPRRLAMRKSGANPDAEWVYMGIVKVKGVPPQKNNAPGIRTNMGITTKAKDAGKILEWLNWTGTPEGSRFLFFGIEGVNYIVKDGKVVVDETVTPISNKHVYAVAWQDRSREVYEGMDFGDIIVKVYDAAKENYSFVDNMMMPITVFDGYEDYSPNESKLYQEKCSKMVLGELPMSAWNGYVKQWRKNGGDEVIKRATAWYKKVHNIQ
ncbi:MAG: extracellular solute-binding protein, partial [Chitinispirillia bacterium]